ncbi:MAG: hypothetical protein U0441_23300 [Polyangiaceae bacterium]
MHLLERRLLKVLAYSLSSEDGTTCVSESPGQDLSPFLAHMGSKGYVLDVTAIPLATLVQAELRAPVLDLRLVPGETERCEIPGDMDLSRLEGLARRLAETKRREPDSSSLDAVSLETYLSYWHAKGARVGRKKGSRVIYFGPNDSLPFKT